MRLGFFLREAVRALKRNAVPSFAAMVTVLVTVLVLGVFIPIVQTANGASNTVRDKVVAKVFLETSATREDRARVQALIERTAKVGDVVFVSKREALAQESERDAEAFELLGTNPLPDSFDVVPETPDDIGAVRDALAPVGPSGRRVPADAAIEDVRNGEESTSKILAGTSAVKYTVAGLAVLLVIASTLLVANTIRLSLYARRREVEVMKLVGATDWFIRWPFVLEGVIVGALGGALAVALLGVLKVSVVDPFVDSAPLLQAPATMNFGVLVALLLAAAVGVSALGSGVSLRRFLRV